MKSTDSYDQSAVPDPGLPPLKGWRKTFAALRNENYRYFYGGQTLSLIGTWARSAAWGWLAFQLTKSEFILGLVFLLNSLPMLVFAIYAGSLADRVPKLSIFKTTSWIAMTCSLTLAILLFRGTIHIGILMSFVALWGMTMAFEMPARQSLMVELVGKKDLVNAIALNSAMVNSTRVIGPALGGLLLSGFGPSWCFLLDALSFLAVLYSLYHIKIENPIHNRNSRRDLAHLLEGFRYLKQHPPLARTVSLLFILSLGGWAYLSQLPAFVQNRLGLGADGYGWLLAMNGLGALTAAIIVASQGASIVKERTLYIGIALYSLFVFLFGFQHDPIGAAFMLYCTGFGIILFFSTGNSFLQSNSPDHLRGRLMGIWALVFGGGMPFGSLWMGIVASYTSSSVALQLGGIFCGTGAFLIYRFLN